MGNTAHMMNPAFNHPAHNNHMWGNNNSNPYGVHHMHPPNPHNLPQWAPGPHQHMWHEYQDPNRVTLYDLCTKGTKAFEEAEQKRKEAASRHTSSGLSRAEQKELQDFRQARAKESHNAWLHSCRNTWLQTQQAADLHIEFVYHVPVKCKVGGTELVAEWLQGEFKLINHRFKLRFTTKAGKETEMSLQRIAENKLTFLGLGVEDDSTITILKLPLSCINTTTTISIDSCPVGIAVELPKCALPERRCRKRSTKPSTLTSTLTRTLTRLPQQKSHQDAACDSSDSDMASSDPFAPITPLVGFDPFAASAAQSQSQDDSCISEQTSMRSDEEKICSSDTSPVSQVNEAALEQELVQDTEHDEQAEIDAFEAFFGTYDPFESMDSHMDVQDTDGSESQGPDGLLGL